MGMRQAINAKCKDCIYDPKAGGTWRQQVEGCTITACGLHPYRPKAAKGASSGVNPGKDAGISE
jgi:hypothetical protein